MPELKTKFDRVKESVEILKKLQEFGVHISEPGYVKTKEILDAWISDGESRSDKIPFPRASRIGHIVLPKFQGKNASYVLKATEELKAAVKNSKNNDPL